MHPTMHCAVALSNVNGDQRSLTFKTARIDVWIMQ